MLSIHRYALGIIAVMLPITTHGLAQEQFPEPGKPITIIVPYAAGGATDGSARLLAQGLQDKLGTPVNIENVPGAASQVGITQLFASAADGYTLSYAVLPTIISHYLDSERGAPYTAESFQTIAMHQSVPIMIGVNVDSAFETLDDLIAAAKAAPGTITISDSGVMGTPNLTARLLMAAAGVSLAEVHFDGGVPSVTAVMGDHVNSVATDISAGIPQVRAGTIRALAVSSAEESPFLPEVPTFTALGYDITSAGAGGIIAPAGVPDNVVQTLTEAIEAVVSTDEHQAALAQLNLIADYMTPEEYRAYWQEQEALLTPIINDILESQR